MRFARDNPFEAGRIERLLTFDPSWLGLTWDEISESAAAIAFRGMIIGPHGSGKTTFCDAFAPRLRAAGYEVIRWFLNDRKPHPDDGERFAIDAAADPSRTVLLVDGVENLGSGSWRKLTGNCRDFAGMFATAHRENRLPQPRFPILLRTETRPEMLVDFVNRLAPEIRWDEAELRRLFDSCGGNLREALWQCYDRLAAGDGLIG